MFVLLQFCTINLWHSHSSGFHLSTKILTLVKFGLISWFSVYLKLVLGFWFSWWSRELLQHELSVFFLVHVKEDHLVWRITIYMKESFLLQYVFIYFSFLFFSSESLACHGNEKINSENYNWILELKYFVEYLEIRINQTYNENNRKSEKNFGAYIEKSRLFLVNLGNHMR